MFKKFFEGVQKSGERQEQKKAEMIKEIIDGLHSVLVEKINVVGNADSQDEQRNKLDHDLENYKRELGEKNYYEIYFIRRQETARAELIRLEIQVFVAAKELQVARDKVTKMGEAAANGTLDEFFEKEKEFDTSTNGKGDQSEIEEVRTSIKKL